MSTPGRPVYANGMYDTNVKETLNYINSLGYESFFYNKNKLLNTNSLDDLNKFYNYIFKPKIIQKN